MALKEPETVPRLGAETDSPTADAVGSIDHHRPRCPIQHADGNMAQQIGADLDDFLVSLDPSFCYVGTVNIHTVGD